MHNPSCISKHVLAVALLALGAAACDQEARSPGQAVTNTDGNSTAETGTSNPVDTPRVPLTAPTVRFVADTVIAAVNDTFTVDVRLDRFPSIEGGGIHLRYPPSLLKANRVTIDENTWDFINRHGTIDNREGRICNILVTSFSGTQDKAVLASIEFTALAAGEGTIEIEPADDAPFTGGNHYFDVRFVASRITVKPARNH